MGLVKWWAMSEVTGAVIFPLRFLRFKARGGFATATERRVAYSSRRTCPSRHLVKYTKQRHIFTKPALNRNVLISSMFGPVTEKFLHVKSTARSDIVCDLKTTLLGFLV